MREYGKIEEWTIMYLRFFFEEMSDLQLFAKKPIKAVNDLKNIKLTAARKVFEKDDFESYYLLAKSICSDI